MSVREERYYKEAKEIVKKKKDFRENARAFAIIIPILAFINIWTHHEFLWFFFPMIGWGIGLVSAYYEAYVKPEKTSWEDHEIQKEMERMRRRDRQFIGEERKRDTIDERLELRELRRDYDERDLV